MFANADDALEMLTSRRLGGLDKHTQPSDAAFAADDNAYGWIDDDTDSTVSDNDDDDAADSPPPPPTNPSKHAKHDADPFVDWWAVDWWAAGGKSIKYLTKRKVKNTKRKVTKNTKRKVTKTYRGRPKSIKNPQK